MLEEMLGYILQPISNIALVFSAFVGLLLHFQSL